MFNERDGISILLVTYNHEQFIQAALDSIARQYFDGPIELVIADDSSTDRTPQIIDAFEGKDERIIFKRLNSSTNLGITKNYKRGFAACTKEYVAVIEGDDFWSSPRKLHEQVQFLAEHWESDICAVNYFVFEEQNSSLIPRVQPSSGHRFISARELISDNIVGNFSTCVYRRSALKRLPDKLFELKAYDWIINIVLARSSLIGFLNTPMSVYRLHAHGAWSQAPYIDKLNAQLQLIPDYNRLTEEVFRAEFSHLSDELSASIRSSQLRRIALGHGMSILGFIRSALDYCPPVILILVKSLTPPIFRKKMAQYFNVLGKK